MDNCKHVCNCKGLWCSDESPCRNHIYNKLLPYADELEIESETFLAEIKASLGRGVLCNETWPTCYFGVQNLCNYMRLYGFKFSKEDHILFIKLLFEIATSSELPSLLTTKCLYQLIILLRKKKLISPKELELPWRPLYKLIVNVLNVVDDPSKEMYRLPLFHLEFVQSLILVAKPYFPLSATREILDELRPTLCPFVPTISRTMKLLRWFLPVQLPPEHHSMGFHLWFEEFMNLWQDSFSESKWACKMIETMAALANYNIGYIDWEPYIPLTFTKFMRCLKLPITYNKTEKIKYYEMDISSMAVWIVAVLGNGSSAQTYLEKFLKTIETYFHPANNGCWLKVLKEILVKLSVYFIARLHKERYAKPTWETPIPEKYKLTESDIDAFVKCMMPVTMTAIFNKLSTNEASRTLQCLATIRPNIVIPYVLDRVSSTLNSVTTEPHKFICALNSMEAIARAMMEEPEDVNKEYVYAEGPTHILSLFYSLASNIDLNNPEKCFHIFRIISIYASFIPIVDSSIIPTDDKEGINYQMASGFDDFVLQFLSTIFSFINSSTLEFVRLENFTSAEKSKLEQTAENVLYEICSILLMQINERTFDAALNEFTVFISEHTLEITVAGQQAAVLCQVFSRINGKKTLRALLPLLSEIILDITGESNDIIKEENLDDRLLHAMSLLCAVVETPGNNLLPYIDTLTTVLDRVLILKSRDGNNLGCMLLKTILHSLSTLVPYRFESTDKMTYWGQTMDINNLNVKWYTPGKEEITIINQMFLKYILPEINKIEEYCKDWTTLTREGLLFTLNTLKCIMHGCDSVLPMWEEEPLDSIKPISRFLSFIPTLGMKEAIKMPDGSNVRQHITKLLSKLQNVMLKNTESDANNLSILTQIWGTLLLGRIYFKENIKIYDVIYNVRRVIKNKLIRKKGIIAWFILLNADKQQELRFHARIVHSTETHKEIMLNLFELATSRYACVRWQAQHIISRAMITIFPYSWKIIIPKLLDVLKQDSEVEHDAYKGALYILLNIHEKPTRINLSWDVLRDLWSALVLSKPSEKLSIIRLKESIMKVIGTHFSPLPIERKIPSATCLEIATAFWTTNPQPSLPKPTEDEIADGLKLMQAFNESNLISYKGLVDDILNALLEKNLHWRHRLMAMNIVRLLIHPEQIYPVKAVRYFLGALIYDSLTERNVAVRIVKCMLQQQKRKHPKITIDPPTLPESPENQRGGVRGKRPNNMWLQYNSDTRPLTAEQWDEPRFIHQPHIGYYTWPKKLEIYAPSSQQPCLDPNIRKLTDHEKEVDHFFNDPQNIQKIIKFYSLETKKGKDEFNDYKYLLFKGLFRNHGIVFLKHFLPHLRELVEDKQETSQKCAAEIIAGIIAGSKHWPFDMVCEMWDNLLPIIRYVINNIATENLRDWIKCFGFAQHRRDPNRQHWLLECIMEETCSGKSKSSSIETAHIQLLHVTLWKQIVRVEELMRRLLIQLEDRILANPYENVRGELGEILMIVLIIGCKIVFSNDETPFQNFINKIVQRLEPLVNENAMKFKKEVENLSEQVATVKLGDLKNPGLSEEEKETAIGLLKTVCTLIITIKHTHNTVPTELYQIFPIIYQLENYEADEELTKLCKNALATYAQATTEPCDMLIVLEAIEKMSRHASRWARFACLEFIQSWVFYNMGTLLSNPTWVNCIKNIVLRLLEDEQLEVRKHAGKVLSGLLHCAFIPEQECLLDEFTKKVKSKLSVKERRLNINNDDLKRNSRSDAIRKRHAAIIGMCAYIQAHPYDVPKFVPPIFEHLSLHMNDPQPIPMTIKKTLDDFKRTHRGWKDIKEYTENFSQEQLTALQDLSVPPSHYT